MAKSPTSRSTQKPKHDTATWERIVFVVCFVLIVVTMLFLVLRNEPFQDPNIVVVTRILLALAVTGLLYSIPGLLRIEVKGKWFVIRAAGASAVFVLLYVGTPTVLSKTLARVALPPRLMATDREYTSYKGEFREAVRDFADTNLDAIFAECVRVLKEEDPAVKSMLEMLESNIDKMTLSDVGGEISAAIGDHIKRLQVVVFGRFNSDLMDELRALIRKRGYSEWTVQALRQWTEIDNSTSMLVENTIADLLKNKRMGSWVAAYFLRDANPDVWSLDKTIPIALNKRSDLLDELDKLVGVALNRGRKEVEIIVRLDFTYEIAPIN